MATAKVFDALASLVRMSATIESLATHVVAQQRRIELLTGHVAHMEGQLGLAPLRPTTTRLPTLEELEQAATDATSPE